MYSNFLQAVNKMFLLLTRRLGQQSSAVNMSSRPHVIKYLPSWGVLESDFHPSQLQSWTCPLTSECMKTGSVHYFVIKLLWALNHKHCCWCISICKPTVPPQSWDQRGYNKRLLKTSRNRFSTPLNHLLFSYLFNIYYLVALFIISCIIWLG